MNAEQIRDEILRINSRIEEAKKDIEKAEKERNSLVEKLREKGFTLIEDSLCGVGTSRPTTGDIVRVCVHRHHWSRFGDTFMIVEDDGSDIPYRDPDRNWYKEDSVEKV